MPMNNREYEVKLDMFEGPLDLLLYLVTKAEVDIVNLPVAQITAQYLEYLDLMTELNIDIAADYLHMAATLTYLKARELLPPIEGEELAQTEEGIYNREELVRQLLEYQKFKQAAGAFKNFETEQIHLFKRGIADAIERGPEDAESVDFGTISLFDILSAFKRVMERAQTDDAYRQTVLADTVKIDDRIERVLSVLTDHAEVRFEELFSDDVRKLVLVVTFMAILELVKMREITFRQEERFGPIFVVRRPQTPETQTPAPAKTMEAGGNL
jgi:segregation and condensation protein A